MKKVTNPDGTVGYALEEREATVALNMIAHALCFEEAYRLLEETPICRHQLKYHAKGLRNEVQPYIEKSFSTIAELDPETAINIFQNKMDLLRFLLQVAPERWQFVAYAVRWMCQPESLQFAKFKALCIEQDALDVAAREKNNAILTSAIH